MMWYVAWSTFYSYKIRLASVENEGSIKVAFV